MPDKAVGGITTERSQEPELLHLPSTPKAHIAFVDGLRALCAVYVVLGHWWSEYDYNPSLHLHWFGVIVDGQFAVDVFIVISGFCLMMPVIKNSRLREGFFGFFKRRARRILPPYYFALALSLLLIVTFVGKKTGTHWDVTLPVRPVDIAAHLFLLQDLHSTWFPKINHALWGISVEWRIYLLFPFLVWIYQKWGARAFVVVAGALSLGSYLLITRGGFGFLYLGASPQYLLLFAFGALAAFIAFSPSKFFLNRKGSASLFIFASAAVTIALPHLGSKFATSFPHLIVSDVAVGLFAAGVLSLLALNSTSVFVRMLSLAPLSFVGTFAYSIYLIHAPLLQCEWQFFREMHVNDTEAFITGCFAGIPLIVAVSYLFYWFCERPYLMHRKSTSVA
jgi:peptidoglycan/LPS O-acetylase OafA/YrhL